MPTTRTPTPPPTAYDVMQRLLPDIEKVTRSVASRWRSRPGWIEGDCWDEREHKLRL